jgi:hypothetical protein
MNIIQFRYFEVIGLIIVLAAILGFFVWAAFNKGKGLCPLTDDEQRLLLIYKSIPEAERSRMTDISNWYAYMDTASRETFYQNAIKYKPY